jgi:Cu(I)/Ag(I) efflux system membrane fusion protein
MKVRAPRRGVVTGSAVAQGKYVGAGAALFTIAPLDRVWAIVDVPASDVGRVRQGQRATVVVDAHPGDRFVGEVALVRVAMTSRTGTLQVRVPLANPGLRLRPGMAGDATIEVDAAVALVVPAEAVVDAGEHRWVLVDGEGGRLVPREVRVGVSDGGRIEILSGVAEGERVVTTARFLLDSESDVRAALGALLQSAPTR